MFGALSSFVSIALLAGLQPAAAQSSSDWAALNTTVGGRLGVGIPWSQPCFSRSPSNASVTPDPTACSEIQSKYEDHQFRSEFFGAYEITQWETCQRTADGCLLDWTSPANRLAFSPPAQCKQGSVPSFFINVQGASDITAAFAFVKKTKVPLVIKNSGHDYIGRSAGPGTLALWTHNLRDISLNKTFVPDGCPSSTTGQSAITIGAGQQFQDIYDFAQANNVTFLGGADPSVGASGGWVQGGGHSALSPSMGLGVDRVLQFKIVTPDGVTRTVNKCQNPDLWFALRGGGGGTFGVILESTFIASPKITVQVVLGQYNNTRANSAKLLTSLAANAVQFATDGWGGYITPPGASAVWMTPSLNATQAQTSAAGVVAAFASVGGNTSFFTMDTFGDFFNTFIAPNTDPAGRPQVMATRLIPSTGFNDTTLIQAVINGMLDSDFGQILAVPPFAFKNFDPNTAINPAWRTSVWHALMSYNWNFDSSPAEIVTAYKTLTQKWAVVRAHTPNSGAYFNEADVFEPNYQQSFWGNNYPKLLAIKQKYDPAGILNCWRCVGWTGASDPRFKCYANVN